MANKMMTSLKVKQAAHVKSNRNKTEIKLKQNLCRERPICFISVSFQHARTCETMLKQNKNWAWPLKLGLPSASVRPASNSVSLCSLAFVITVGLSESDLWTKVVEVSYVNKCQ